MKMKPMIKTIELLALLTLANAGVIKKRDPYWVKMSDVIQQVRPDFYFGVATSIGYSANPKYKDIVSSFNLQVGGNECKFYTIQSSQTRNFNQCDQSLSYAKKFGAKYRGHNLFWPANSPSWFKTYSDDIEVTKSYIIEYITSVLEHYRDDDSIIYWDVINESVMDDSTSNDIHLRTGSKTSDEFLGWDTYTEDIFRLARNHVNENVKLIYNDYYCEANNGNFDGKTGAVFNYIKEMKEKEVPIDGVGLQMHVSCNDAPSYDDLYRLISQYEEIGVEVHVTEIDVTMARCNSLKEQKEVYMNVFKACFDHNNCKVFTVWGAYDTESWIGAENTPLIFDSDMYPKDIYFEMLDYVLNKLPSGATYPTPTVTSKPTTSTQTPEVSSNFIIKPETYMIDGNWSNWSWECQSVEFDEEGNEVISFTEDKYGAFSLHTTGVFNAGKFHFEMKADDEDAFFNLIVHTVNEGEFVSLKQFNINTSNKMEAFDIDVPSVDGGYNRVSIQNYGAKNVTIAVNNFYFIEEVGEEEKDNSTSENTVYLVKPNDYMINPSWGNWSWDTESLNFDDEGNAVVTFSDGKYGAFSLHSQDTFNAAQFHFELKTDTASASLKFMVHSKVSGEFIEIQSLSDLSTEKMKSYTFDVPFHEEGYNRVSIQNANAKNITIYINNYYYVPVEEEEKDNSVPENAVYLVKPNDYMINPTWNNWSWGTDSVNFDDEGNAVVLYSDGTYGAFSLLSRNAFNAAQFHFELKTDTATASLKFLVHSKDSGEFIEIQSLSKLSTEKMKSYTINVPFLEEGYNRVSIQNMSAKNITIYINNYYYVPVPVEEATTTSAAPAPAPTTEQMTTAIAETTAVTEPVEVSTVTPTPTLPVVDKPTDINEDEDETEATTTITDDNEPETTIIPYPGDEPEPIPVENKCWSEELGFPCCTNDKTKVKLEDINGKWGKEKGQWCGIKEELDDSCWASKIGYPCCKKKKGHIYKVNSYGSWGIEKNKWCGIVSVEECEFSKTGYTCCPNAKGLLKTGHKWGYSNGKICGVKY